MDNARSKSCPGPEPHHLSLHGLGMIKEFEGFRPTAYKDSRGILTIGYGHTKDVSLASTCSQVKALEWLSEDTEYAVAAVNRLVTVPLTQNQFDALVSLVYNIGAGAFEESHLLVLLNGRDYGDASKEFNKWTRAGSDKHALTARRAQESILFDIPDQT